MNENKVKELTGGEVISDVAKAGNALEPVVFKDGSYHGEYAIVFNSGMTTFDYDEISEFSWGIIVHTGSGSVAVVFSEKKLRHEIAGRYYSMSNQELVATVGQTTVGGWLKGGMASVKFQQWVEQKQTEVCEFMGLPYETKLQGMCSDLFELYEDDYLHDEKCDLTPERVDGELAWVTGSSNTANQFKVYYGG